MFLRIKLLEKYVENNCISPNDFASGRSTLSCKNENLKPEERKKEMNNVKCCESSQMF
jgi:hypothetical protein